jgi:hypothetical protein
MRDRFSEYFPLSDAEYRTLWDLGQIVLDANVLLNLYRYSAQAQTELLDILGIYKDRLWIPNQVAAEYFDNRLSVIAEQREQYSKLMNEFSTAQVRLLAEASKKHPTINAAELTERINLFFAKIREYLEDKEAHHPDPSSGVAPGQVDPIRDRIAELFNGRVGDPFPSEELEAIYKLGESRYESLTPPGFKDRNKDGNEKYGDLVLWFEILRRAEEYPSQPFIFVTDDSKDDWWERFQGKRVGPHKVLLREFRLKNSSILHMYSPEAFLDAAKEVGGQTVSSESVDEIRQVSADLKRDNELELYSEGRKKQEALAAELEYSTLRIQQLTRELDALPLHSNEFFMAMNNRDAILRTMAQNTSALDDLDDEIEYLQFASRTEDLNKEEYMQQQDRMQELRQSKARLQVENEALTYELNRLDTRTRITHDAEDSPVDLEQRSRIIIDQIAVEQDRLAQIRWSLPRFSGPAFKK